MFGFCSSKFPLSMNTVDLSHHVNPTTVRLYHLSNFLSLITTGRPISRGSFPSTQLLPDEGLNIPRFVNVCIYITKFPVHQRLIVSVSTWLESEDPIPLGSLVSDTVCDKSPYSHLQRFLLVLSYNRLNQLKWHSSSGIPWNFNVCVVFSTLVILRVIRG